MLQDLSQNGGDLDGVPTSAYPAVRQPARSLLAERPAGGQPRWGGPGEGHGAAPSLEDPWYDGSTGIRWALPIAGALALAAALITGLWWLQGDGRGNQTVGIGGATATASTVPASPELSASSVPDPEDGQLRSVVVATVPEGSDPTSTGGSTDEAPTATVTTAATSTTPTTAASTTSTTVATSASSATTPSTASTTATSGVTSTVLSTASTASTTSTTVGSTTATSATTGSTASSTTAVEAPAPVPPAGGDGAAQQAILDATNAERAKAGCAPLRLDATLNAVADAHSHDMADRGFFDHDDPDGRGPGDRVRASGYPFRTWGENIAAGYRSASAVMTGWMDSDGHRRNILNCDFQELGVGHAEGGPWGIYWTQVFGTRR